MYSDQIMKKVLPTSRIPKSRESQQADTISYKKEYYTISD